MFPQEPQPKGNSLLYDGNFAGGAIKLLSDMEEVHEQILRFDVSAKGY